MRMGSKIGSNASPTKSSTVDTRSCESEGTDHIYKRLCPLLRRFMGLSVHRFIGPLVSQSVGLSPSIFLAI